MKYIVKIQDVKDVLGITPDIKLTFGPVELTGEQVEQLQAAGKEVREPQQLDFTPLDDIDYEKKRSTWVKFQKKNITGRGVKVAVLDNGIATGFFPVEYTQNYTTAGLTGSHGTMTCSIVKDLAPDCELHAVKVVDSTITEADMLEGLNYCLINGIHVVNMSFNIIRTSAIDSALDDLNAAGIIMFASAGNNSTPADLSYPAWHRNVIAVNAVKDDGTAAYKNWNIPSGGTHGIHLACAGWGNRVVDYLGNVFGNYGTSFSSPFAAGIMALVLEEIGLENISKARQVLFNKAVKQSDAIAFGYGILNC